MLNYFYLAFKTIELNDFFELANYFYISFNWPFK
jgi:hypothetical protein